MLYSELALKKHFCVHEHFNLRLANSCQMQFKVPVVVGAEYLHLKSFPDLI